MQSAGSEVGASINTWRPAGGGRAGHLLLGARERLFASCRRGAVVVFLLTGAGGERPAADSTSSHFSPAANLSVTAPEERASRFHPRILDPVR